MKEWRTTVGDYVQEMQDAKKGFVIVAIVLLLIIVIPIGLALINRQLTKEFYELYDGVVELIDDRKYEDAADSFERMYQISEGLKNHWLAGVRDHFRWRLPDFSDEIEMLLTKMMRDGEFLAGCGFATGQLAGA